MEKPHGHKAKYKAYVKEKQNEYLKNNNDDKYNNDDDIVKNLYEAPEIEIESSESLKEFKLKSVLSKGVRESALSKESSKKSSGKTNSKSVVKDSSRQSAATQESTKKSSSGSTGNRSSVSKRNTKPKTEENPVIKISRYSSSRRSLETISV